MSVKPTISKTQYMKGLQCAKSLWYYKNRKDLSPEIDTNTQAKFDTGHEIGAYAQRYYDGGVLVDNQYWDVSGAIKKTEGFISQGKKIIYEATTMHPVHGGYSRIDILRKDLETKTWDLIEVKSSTSVKDYHIDDLSFQYHVFNCSGYKINRCYLMHIDNQYVRNGDIDPHGLLKLEDVTEQVISKQVNIEALSHELVTLRDAACEPDISIGHHCFSPFECDYKEHCWKHVPTYSIYNVYPSKKAEQIYTSTSSFDLRDVPTNLYPGGLKKIDVDCFVNDNENIDRDAIQSFLSQLVYPLYYLDYETLFPAIPLFDGTRPYQQIPFQFSLHILNKSGNEPSHHEYLHNPIDDPREAFTEKLISLCGDSGSVIVYNKSMEASRNNELAVLFPHHAERLKNINDRMVDLMDVFRKRQLYNHKQMGSYSIKTILPIYTDMSYGNLSIADGGTASLLYLDMLQDKLTNEEIEITMNNLLEYCKMDTLAMVKLVDKLLAF